MLKSAALALSIALLGLAGVTAGAAQKPAFPTGARTAISVGSAPLWGIVGIEGTNRGSPLESTEASDLTLSALSMAEGEEESNHEGLFKLINFVILVGALGYLLRKPLGAFFADRSESIHKGLEAGRKALEASQAQLEAIERKLRGLEEEIARFKAESAREMEVERERVRQAAAAEAERMLAFARAQIESAARAAKLELKAFAARQAVDLAEQTIRQRLDEAGRRQLVDRFVRELSQKPN